MNNTVLYNTLFPSNILLFILQCYCISFFGSNLFLLKKKAFRSLNPIDVVVVCLLSPILAPLTFLYYLVAYSFSHIKRPFFIAAVFMDIVYDEILGNKVNEALSKVNFRKLPQLKIKGKRITNLASLYIEHFQAVNCSQVPIWIDPSHSIYIDSLTPRDISYYGEMMLSIRKVENSSCVCINLEPTKRTGKSVDQPRYYFKNSRKIKIAELSKTQIFIC